MAMDVDSGRGSDQGGGEAGGQLEAGDVARSPGAGSVLSVGSSRRASTVGGGMGRRRCVGTRLVPMAC